MPKKTCSWARHSDAELLRLRFRDLHLGMPRRALLLRGIHRLRRELAARGLLIEPHFWFSDEWFSPDGVPGIAVPFYLAHPRLERLERRMARSVDGGNATGLMQILRHEAGHVVDTAYRLRRRKLWRQTFGSPTSAYPQQYQADPSSSAYVRHLDGWYAQAHPAEDFAETFAVWLAPRSNWRRRYAGSAAHAKLLVMDRLMQSVCGKCPPVRSAYRIDPVASKEITLREHYRANLQRRMSCDFSMVDRVLNRCFAANRAAATDSRTSRRAASSLRGMRRQLVRHAMARTGIDEYGARQLVQLAIERAEERRLWLRGNMERRRELAERMVRRLSKAAMQGERIKFTL